MDNERRMIHGPHRYRRSEAPKGTPPEALLAPAERLAYDQAPRDLFETDTSSVVIICSSNRQTAPPARRQVLCPVLVVLVFALAISGCGQIKEDAKRIALENTLSSYRQSIRWGYFPAAAGFVTPEQRPDLDMERLANVRVTGYEVVQPGVVAPDDTVAQVVRIAYVLEDRQRLEQLVDRQRWRYDPLTGAWWLESGLPSFAD
jgi:hypothetical protein